jgi:hypothetical protein
MAENRGGMRPTAPQNNPANVSGTGGAGQSGKYSGFAYGQNQQINNQISQGDAAVKSVSSGTPTTASIPQTPTMPITAGTTNPNESVMAGLTPFGQPNNPNELGLPVEARASDPEEAMIRDYFPIIEFWANQPGVSNTTKEYAAYLRTIL